MNSTQLDLPEVYGIWTTSFWQTEVGYGILIFIGVSILLGGLWILRRSMLSKNKFPAPLLRRLKMLSEKKFSSREQYYQAYQELTDSLKCYMQGVYKGTPRGITDWELIEEVKKRGYDEATQRRLNELIEHAQGVKFAHQTVLEKHIKSDIMYTISFISTHRQKSS